MFIYKRRIFFWLIISLGLSCIAFFMGTTYVMHREFADTHIEYTSLLKTVSMDLGYTMEEIKRLSQLLMLNSDIRYFVSRPPIEKGSAHIQSLIDAQNHLSDVISVYPFVETLYVYSKNSDYLLESNNAFFSIDKMYSALFAFDGLNSGQWRFSYLLPVYTNRWFSRTGVRINGIVRDVIPFAQTFPLINPSANSGKLIIVCKTTFFDDIMASLRKFAGSTTYILDGEGVILHSNGILPSQKIVDVGRQAIDGRMYQVFAEDIGLDYRIISAVPYSALFTRVKLASILILVFFGILCCLGFLWAIVLQHKKSKNMHILCHKNCSPLCDEAKSIHKEGIVVFENIEEYIKNNYQNPLLNLSQMAQAFGTKESFLYHFFKVKVQKSFSYYLENYRLQHARLKLKSDITMSIAKLAENCGYANAQTFRRAFKKKFGCTPSEYKEELFCKL